MVKYENIPACARAKILKNHRRLHGNGIASSLLKGAFSTLGSYALPTLGGIAGLYGANSVKNKVAKTYSSAKDKATNFSNNMKYYYQKNIKKENVTKPRPIGSQTYDIKNHINGIPKKQTYNERPLEPLPAEHQAIKGKASATKNVNHARSVYQGKDVKSLKDIINKNLPKATDLTKHNYKKIGNSDLDVSDALQKIAIPHTSIEYKKPKSIKIPLINKELKIKAAKTIEKNPYDYMENQLKGTKFLDPNYEIPKIKAEGRKRKYKHK